MVLVALEAGAGFLKLWEVRPYSDCADFFFSALCRSASDLSIEGGSHLNKWL